MHETRNPSVLVQMMKLVIINYLEVEVIFILKSFHYELAGVVVNNHEHTPLCSSLLIQEETRRALFPLHNNESTFCKK